MRPVVVGVDASDQSRRALRWAAEEAALRGVLLEAVHVVPPRDVPSYRRSLPMPSRDDLDLAGHRLIETQLAEAQVPDVRVNRAVVSGRSPAEALCVAAREADLLVVGARGLGGFAGLLLGSVSQQAVAHAPCPVVVVGPARD
jgi:nucleotide-binding universal stress UspA family protein